MRRGLATLLLMALLGAVGLVLASPAQACSCADGSTQQYLDGADAVFTGRLVSRTVDHPDWPVMGSGDPALLVFATDRVFKGDVHAAQGVVTAAEGASCGLELSGEGLFLVFAQRDADLPDGQFRAGLCGGTAPADDAFVAEVSALAGPDGGAVVDGSGGTDARGLGVVPTALLGLGVLGVLAAGGLLLRRGRRGA